jgi:biopolymer transport protein ExbD
MNISFSCPICQKQLSARPTAAGQQRTCPRCRNKVIVPMESQPLDSRGAQGDKDGGPSDHGQLLLRTGGGHQEDLIDMTAMVDIVFFLLIFFMVTSLQALQAVIGLPTPQSSSSAPSAQTVTDIANDPSFVTVRIEEDDTVWVEDEQAFGPQDLRVKLRQQGDKTFQPTGMMLVGHPEASHGTLVMVFDAAADAGLNDLRFSVSEDPQGVGG